MVGGDSSHNTIGGVAAPNGRGAANIIAFNALDGVFIQSGIDNGIHENSIYANGSLGIDLGSGANLNQAAPVLTSVQTRAFEHPGVRHANEQEAENGAMAVEVLLRQRHERGLRAARSSVC